MSAGPNKLSRRQFLRAAGVTAGALGLSQVGGGRHVFAQTARSVSRRADKLVILASADLQPYYEYLNQRFEEEFGVTCELQTVGIDQLYTRAATILSSGSSDVDIIEMDSVWTADFGANEWAAPLDGFLSDDETSQLQPGLLDGVSSDGKILAMPFTTQFKVLFYNTEVLENMGLDALPATYEQLVEQGAEAQASKLVKYPQGWGWSQAEGMLCDWTQILYAFGGQWFEDGQWAFNNEAAIAALSYMVDNLKSKVFDPASVTYNDRTVMNPFFAGDYLAMASWGLWGWNMSNDPNESGIVGKVDVGLMYGTEQAGVTSATCAGGGGLALNPNSENQDLAAEWLKRLAGIDHPENQIFALENVGNLPALAALWNDPQVEEANPILPKMGEQANHLVFRPGNHVLGYQNWSNMVQVELSAALTFQKTPEEALNEAVAKSNADFPPFGLEA